MSFHILSAGIIPANCHAVFLPNIEGLARASCAFFLSPNPNTDLKPPIPCDINMGIPEDNKILRPEIGLRNWKPGMLYKDWNEAIVKGYQNVFFNKRI